MNIFAIDALVIWFYVTIFFGLATWKKRNDLADIAWGLGFALLAWVSGIVTSHLEIRQIVLATVVSVWALRLSGFVLWRSRQWSEDPRYTNMRKTWGTATVIKSYFRVFVFQGLILLVLAVPLILTMSSERGSIGTAEIVGVGLSIFGMIWEAVADQQKYAFKQAPGNKNRLMTRGLWSLVRHPNYFGESLVWWGVYIYACGDSRLAWTVFSPALLTFLLLKVSGVPLLEKRYQGQPEFEEYRRKTPMFIPWIGWK